MTGKRYILIELFLVIILSYLLINLFLTYNREQTVSSNIVVEEKICYLTFDDGPSKNTEKILDILAEYDAKATFFLLGCELSEEKRPVLERIIKEGHEVGLHSNIHKYDKLYADEETCLKDFDSEYQVLKEEYGVDTKLLRFPGGSTCVCLKGRRESFINKMRENGFRCLDCIFLKINFLYIAFICLNVNPSIIFQFANHPVCFVPCRFSFHIFPFKICCL